MTRQLPSDSTLLPLEDGALLVSPTWATFCRVSVGELAGLRRVLAGLDEAANVGFALRRDLEVHGFYAAPRSTPKSRPKLRIQLTNRCNLACAYCCTNSGQAWPHELQFDEWIRIIDEACEFAGSDLDIELLGGEPLLAPRVIDIGTAIVDRGRRLTLFTNGVLLAEPDLARGVAQLQQRGAEIRVSLAALSPERCDAISGGERFDRLLLGLQNPELCPEHLRVDIMLFPDTVDDICQNLRALRSRLPNAMRVTLGLAFLGGRELGRHMFPSRTELETALDRIAFTAGESIAGPSRMPLANRREACHCAYGNDLSVRSDGMLFGCFRMEEPFSAYEPGNLATLWQRMRSAPQLAHKTRFCAHCPLVSLCGGGCRSENLLSTGDADKPDCGPWRVRVISELLAEDNVAALEWPAIHLRAEARRRGIDLPELPLGSHHSLHVIY
jgi:radical SAM protein with 4Fe4S-binding SPASM domain